MNIDKLQALQREWGNKPCDHPDIISDPTAKPEEDKWRCLQCGSEVGYEEWQKARNQAARK